MICVQKSGYPEAMHGNHNPHSFKFDFFTSRSLSTLYFCALQFVLDHVSCSIHDHVLYMYALRDLVYWVLKYTTDVCFMLPVPSWLSVLSHTLLCCSVAYVSFPHCLSSNQLELSSVPNHTILWLTVPYHTILYRAIPYQTISCHIISPLSVVKSACHHVGPCRPYAIIC